MWRDIVDSMPAAWLSRAQHPLLMAYCRHVARAEMLAATLNEFRPEWLGEEGGLQRLDKLLAMAERESRALTACARSMRLTHQSAYGPRKAATVLDAVAGPRP